METLKINKYISFKCRDIDAYVFKIAVKEILPIFYVAVRGINHEEGAVQRVLSTKRIGDIANYVLAGNMFLNTFILNWANQECSITVDAEGILIPKVPNSLQVIDGQHRLEGIKKACEANPDCGDKEILVVLTNRLSTTLAAEVFLNINSEQKQVPKSLVYDLFGEIRDPAYNINRARELAEKMNNELESPYYQSVKMPGASNKGKVDLATIVSSLKDHLKDGGTFDQYNLMDFELQYRILLNYHTVLKNAYKTEWLHIDNPFFTNAGFYAMTKFFCEKIIPLCVQEGSFEVKYIEKILDFSGEDLLYRKEIKNMQGKEQRQEIYNYLLKILTKDIPNKNGYKF